ncbi:MAG: phage holin family protein [Oscillospiraceae bacterium]|jgi:toxin secretion/phage lysis holin|nr:phage holin family protein [Oscillospiraceae bacterium]
MERWRTIFCGGAGAVGGAIAAAFGGWSNDLTVLVAFMVIDYVTGMLAAALNRSEKTEGGGLSSSVGWAGLVKKIGTLLLVLVAHGLDVTMRVDYVQTAAIVAFIANETLSILENAALLGIPMPEIFKRALEVLKGKSKEASDGKNE